MKTEQAIKLLHRLQDEQFDGIHGDERREALSMAVRALSGEGDMISRQAAINVLDVMTQTIAERDVRKGVSMAWQQIKDLPSA